MLCSHTGVTAENETNRVPALLECEIWQEKVMMNELNKQEKIQVVISVIEKT